MRSIIIAATCWMGVGLLTGCTKLDEKLNAELTLEEAQEIADINGLQEVATTHSVDPSRIKPGYLPFRICHLMTVSDLHVAVTGMIMVCGAYCIPTPGMLKTSVSVTTSTTCFRLCLTQPTC